MVISTSIKFSRLPFFAEAGSNVVRVQERPNPNRRSRSGRSRGIHEQAVFQSGLAYILQRADNNKS